MNKNVLQRLLFFTCSLIVFSVTFYGCSILPDDDETLSPPANIKVQKNQYELYKVVKKDIEQTIKGNAKLVAAKKAELFFSEPGSRIKSINVSTGDTVKKGSALITLDTSDISDNIKFQESEIKKIQLRLDTQKSLLKKYESMPKEYQPSQKDLNDMVSSIKLIEIDLANANITLDGYKRKLSQSVLTAPFDGIITFLDPKTLAGDMAEAYKRIVTVSDSNKFELSYQVPPQDARTIKIGMKVEVTYKGTKCEGIVTMAPYDDPESTDEVTAKDTENEGNAIMAPSDIPESTTGKSVSTAIIRIKELPAEAKFGDTAEFKIAITSKSNVISIPKRALKTNFTGKYVQIMDGEMKKVVNVEVGLETALDAEILSGLTEGQKVILN